jgi:predicted metal-dependent enzyme (double-stranded beta helix superfamily)
LKSSLIHTAALVLLPLALSASALGASEHAATEAAAQHELLLDNSRVLVERFVLQPGQSPSPHSHSSDQLLVFVKGGVLKSAATGRSTLWRDGRVLWRSSTDPANDVSRNAGPEPIVMIRVTLKPVLAAASAAKGGKEPPPDQHLNYPNIPGEDLLENSRVIVQRFTVNPGQWEGVHAHRPNMLYIHIKGGQWAARSRKEPEHPYPEASPDGEVGWMAPIDISEGHESGNVGPQPIDLIWVTLKE